MRKGLLAAMLLSVLSTNALASRSSDDDGPPPDARTEGYAQENVNTNNGIPPVLIQPQSGSFGTWFVTGVLGALCVGVMLKSGKRSHLD